MVAGAFLGYPRRQPSVARWPVKPRRLARRPSVPLGIPDPAKLVNVGQVLRTADSLLHLNETVEVDEGGIEAGSDVLAKSSGVGIVEAKGFLEKDLDRGEAVEVAVQGEDGRVLLGSGASSASAG